MVHYGALPLPAGAGSARRRSLVLPQAAPARAAAALAGVVAAAALVLLAAQARDGKSELFYARFPRAPTTQLVRWDGCGAGGDCGGRYHWTAHSYSPVRGRQIDMQFSHDHNSIGNWWNRTAFEMGMPGPRAYGDGYWVRGAHRAYDFSNGTYGYGGAYKGLTPSFNYLPEVNATWEPELIDPLEYWAQFFPVEKGYSSNLFGEAEEEEEEEEEEAAEEEEEEAEEAPPPPHLFGRENQMIFADLEPLHSGAEFQSVVNGPLHHRVTPGHWCVWARDAVRLCRCVCVCVCVCCQSSIGLCLRARVRACARCVFEWLSLCAYRSHCDPRTPAPAYKCAPNIHACKQVRHAEFMESCAPGIFRTRG